MSGKAYTLWLTLRAFRSMTMMYWIEETGDVRLGPGSGDVGGVIEGG